MPWTAGWCASPVFAGRTCGARAPFLPQCLQHCSCASGGFCRNRQASARHRFCLGGRATATVPPAADFFLPCQKKVSKKEALERVSTSTALPLLRPPNLQLVANERTLLQGTTSALLARVTRQTCHSLPQNRCKQSPLPQKPRTPPRFRRNCRP